VATADGGVTGSAQKLPRLAVIADVAPEQVDGGALLLHRLLKEYPPERLFVVCNPEFATGDPARRLPGVTYRNFHYRVPRLIRNRFNPAWPVVMAAAMRRHTGAVARAVADFAPDAVLTVPHLFLWFSAARVARTLRVPLHLIVHDDWPSYITFRRSGWAPRMVRWGCRKIVGPVYRQAASRLCVSHGMEEHCERWYGVGGTVLYPARGDDSPPPRVRVRREESGPPVVAFCGNIHQDGTADLLRELAGVLASLKGRLDVYSQVPADRLAALGLTAPVVRHCGFFPAAEMGERVSRTAHVLFLPASFEVREREDVSTLFPSKLADYTAVGLPVLAWAPSYSSAARWAIENPGAVALVSQREPDTVREVLSRLARDSARAEEITAAGIEAGRRCFEPAAAWETFVTSLCQGSTSHPGFATQCRSGFPAMASSPPS